MKETASLLVASVERKGRIMPNLHNWQKRCLMCTSMNSVSSIKRPRILTDWENGMLWPDMDTGVKLRVTWLIFGLVPMAMSSVVVVVFLFTSHQQWGQFYHGSSLTYCHTSTERHLQYSLSNYGQELGSLREFSSCGAGNHLQRNGMSGLIDKWQC